MTTTTIRERYTGEQDDARATYQRLEALGIRDRGLQQHIAGCVLEHAKMAAENPTLVRDGWLHLDPTLTEVETEPGETPIYTVRLYGRAWTDQPAQPLTEINLTW